jgi:hypothetical protein
MSRHRCERVSRSLCGMLLVALASLGLVPSAGGAPRQVVEAMASRERGIADPSAYLDYYGSVRWDSVFDWWRGP